MKHILLLAGSEIFNAGLDRRASERSMAQCPRLKISVFSDRDLTDAADMAVAADAGR